LGKGKRHASVIAGREEEGGRVQESAGAAARIVAGTWGRVVVMKGLQRM
jgi:hypothetical protein